MERRLTVAWEWPCYSRTLFLFPQHHSLFAQVLLVSRKRSHLRKTVLREFKSQTTNRRRLPLSGKMRPGGDWHKHSMWRNGLLEEYSYLWGLHKCWRDVLKKRFLSLEAHQDSFPIEFAFFWSLTLLLDWYGPSAPVHIRACTHTRRQTHMHTHADRHIHMHESIVQLSR